MAEHYGPWEQTGSGGWIRHQIEDCCAVSTGTRAGGFYPFMYRGEERRCGCKAPPESWWCAGRLPCGCPSWHPTAEVAKSLIDAELLAEGCILYDSKDDASLAEESLKRLEDGRAVLA